MKSFDIFLSQVFLSLETFLQKASNINIFEALIFNYKIKISSDQQCSHLFLGFVVDFCNDLQVILRECVQKPILGDKPDSFCDEHSTNTEYISSTSLQSEKVADPNENQNLANDDKPAEEKLPSVLQDNTKIFYTCEHCNRKFRSSEKFSKHVCKFVNSEINKNYKNTDDLESTISDQAADKEKLELPVFVCANCFSSFSQKHLFDQHSHADRSLEVELITDTATLQKHRKFSCGICCEVYRSLPRILYHVSRCQVGPYQCELCPFLASTKQLLNQHKKKHHKGVESFFCVECGLGFKLRASLQKHMVKRHENELNHFPCDTDGCLETFTKKIHLTNHRIEVHGVERKFLCQVCGHKFMTQESLSNHLEWHANKRKFECVFCSKIFATKEKMTFHVRTHTGEKPFVCDQLNCQKSFVSKSKLTEHLQRHSGEKKHKCSICSKQYANKIDLKTHIRKIHQEKSVDQEECRSTSMKQHIDTEVPTSGTDVYSSPLVLQVDAPYNNIQFYPVSIPQTVVVTSHDAVVTL